MLGTAAKRWLNRDDVTDDLVPLSAEREVLDWMGETPAPPKPRPGWLPAAELTPVPAPRRPARGSRPRPSAARAPWTLIAAGLVATIAMGAGAAASLIGVAVAFL